MSEIEKLYENANIEPIDTKYEPMGNMVFTADCIGNTWTREQYMKEVPVYPEFTAEKQLELLCFLINFGVKITMQKCNIPIKTENIANNLTGITNEIWQDFTEQEKEEIKRILE